MRRIQVLISVCFLYLLLFPAQFAYAVEIRTETVENVTYYVPCDTHGEYLHTPVPYEIEPALTLYDDCGNFLGEVYGFVGVDGNYLAIILDSYFSGFIFSDVFCCSESLIPVADLNGKYGYLDQQGNIVIPCQWSWAEPFENGVAIVSYETAYSYANVWIDKSGRIISLDPEYGYTLQENNIRQGVRYHPCDMLCRL